MKRIKQLACALLMVAMVSPFAEAVEVTTKITIAKDFGVLSEGGEDAEFTKVSVPSVVQNGRTLVPIRDVVEAFGSTVTWNGETQSVEIIRSIPVWDSVESAAPSSELANYYVRLKINDSNMYYSDATHSGIAIKLDVAPQLINGRTMLPLRAVCEGLNCKVDWWGNNEIGLYPIAYELNKPPYEGEFSRGNINQHIFGNVAANVTTKSYSKFGLTMQIPEAWFSTYEENRYGSGYFTPTEHTFNSTFMVYSEPTLTNVSSAKFLDNYIAGLSSYTNLVVLEKEMRTTQAGTTYSYLKFTGNMFNDAGVECAFFEGSNGTVVLQLNTDISEVGRPDIFSAIANSVTK